MIDTVRRQRAYHSEVDLVEVGAESASSETGVEVVEVGAESASSETGVTGVEVGAESASSETGVEGVEVGAEPAASEATASSDAVLLNCSLIALRFMISRTISASETFGLSQSLPR